MLRPKTMLINLRKHSRTCSVSPVLQLGQQTWSTCLQGRPNPSVITISPLSIGACLLHSSCRAFPALLSRAREILPPERAMWLPVEFTITSAYKIRETNVSVSSQTAYLRCLCAWSKNHIYDVISQEKFHRYRKLNLFLSKTKQYLCFSHTMPIVQGHFTKR